ncbi:catalase [Sphingomonas koreensis]|nr:catalase [Sphingomonas koreensis]
MVAPPVRYSPDVEQAEPDEAETSVALRETLHDILQTTSTDYGHAVRSVHAKGHALIDATLIVADDLPADYAQGLFAKPGRYPAILRISTTPGDILDDSISAPRGLALKVIGVEGARLPGGEGDTTQDFVMANGPAFAAPDAKHFLGNLKLLAKTTDRAEWAKKILSAALRATEATLEAFGGESAAIKSLGGAPNVHPLGETYFSQTPYRYGDFIAKFQVAPVSVNLTRLTGEKIAAAGRPDALREDVMRDLAQGGAWEVRIQLNRDLAKMPIENAATLWDEADSPFVTVARIEAGAQKAWQGADSVKREDALAFSPWHGLAAHQPLGSINRVRQPAYQMSADFRGTANGCPIHEPRAAVVAD